MKSYLNTHDDQFYSIDAITLLPVVSSCGKKITEIEIQRAIDDDDIRYLEMLGISKGSIEKSLTPSELAE